MTSATISAFSLVDGTCVVDGACATTSGFPSNYGDHEECSVTVQAAGFLTATTFDTEYCCDELTVSSTEYSGIKGPVHQPIPSGAVVMWKSDGDTNAQGWRLCYNTTGPPTPAPTTIAPTIAPITGAPTAALTMEAKCSVFVDASTGADSDTCGSSSSDACASIQRGIDSAQQDGEMICISEGAHPSISFRVVEHQLQSCRVLTGVAGTYGCEGGWAAQINRSLTIKGL